MINCPVVSELIRESRSYLLIIYLPIKVLENQEKEEICCYESTFSFKGKYLNMVCCNNVNVNISWLVF